MSKVSSTFKSKIGRGTLVNWPLGVTGKGNSGVAGVLSATSGAIAYMGVDYVLLNHLRKAALRNNAGKFELPGLAQIAAAAATVKSVPANNAISISNPPGSAKNAYPAATFTWVIVPLKTSVAVELKSFITWAVTTGQKYAPHLLFTPISAAVRNAALRSVVKIHT
jgi:phosphate transport system substrate-binding protein